MVPVEIDFYSDTLNSQNRLVRRIAKEETTDRGNIYKLKFLAPAKVLVTCDPQDNFGTIIVRGREFVEIRIYENEDDLIGKRARTNQPIKFSGNREVEIWANHKRRQILVWHEKNYDEFHQSIPKAPERITL